MKNWCCRIALVLVCLFLLPRETPAPLIYRPGEGWTYEPVGGERWTRTRAVDQVQVARDAFEREEYRLAIKAARRTVRAWPLSDFAPEAQFILARSLEARGRYERAFREYQKLLEKYPKAGNYEEVLERQFAIANRFLDGQWFKLWGFIPTFSNMERTAQMYEKIVKNGPYSEIAPQAQMSIGAAHEKRFPPNLQEAVKAYETAADRYYEQRQVAADALFKAAQAYLRQARRAEYDQSVAQRAIETFTDFISLYPNDSRLQEAQDIILSLKTEQARGNFEIARYYERKKKWEGALIYYNETVQRDPDSLYADEARQRISAIQQRLGRTPRQTARN